MAKLRTQGYYDSAPWRGTWSAEGGGALLNQGIHFLDLFQWLAGMPKVVFGHAATVMHDIEVGGFGQCAAGVRERRPGHGPLQYDAGALTDQDRALG